MQKHYNALNDREIIIHGQRFFLECDSKNQSFRLYQKGIIGAKGIDHKISFSIQNTLKDGYCEKVTRAFPYNSYLLIDAQSIKTLCTEGMSVLTQEKVRSIFAELLMALFFFISFVFKDNKTTATKNTSKINELGEKEYFYKVPAHLVDITKLKMSGISSDRRLCVQKNNKRLLINQNMFDFLTKKYKITNGTFNIGDASFTIYANGDFYDVHQVDESDQKIDIDSAIIAYLQSLQEVPVILDDGDAILFNQKAWEKYRHSVKNDDFINDKDFHSLVGGGGKSESQNHKSSKECSIKG